ncbi:Gfo/Idh/MocA family protein [Roseobacteraceae bacterium S113]
MRLGLAGAGLVGQQHIKAIEKTRGAVTLSAVFDPATDEGPLPYVESFSEVIAASDGVLLAVPNHLHAPLAEDCIAAGKPVLIEKPITDSTQSARALTEMGAGAKVPILVGHHRRHNPIIAKAHDILTSGVLGQLTSVHVNTWLPKPESYFAQSWRQGAGAGPLFINLIHDVDLIQHLCGRITAVQAMQSNAVRGADVEETLTATARFENGMLGTLNLSDAACGPWSWELTAGENPAYHQTDQSAYRIGGTHGSLTVPDLKLWSQENGPHWWEPMNVAQQQVAHGEALVNQLLHFADVVAGRAAPLVSGADGLAALRVIEALKEAAESGCLVDV